MEHFYLKAGVNLIVMMIFSLLQFSLPYSVSVSSAHSSHSFDDLDRFMDGQFRKGRIKGLSAAIVRKDRVLWKRSLGHANVERNVRTTDESIFLLASVSKTVTAVALMTLFEKGAFQLDDPINNHLPFQIRHPQFPDRPLTFRMLLTHTAGISDTGYDKLDLYTYGKDSTIPLKAFIRDYFHPQGRYYSKRDNFHHSPPGQKYVYSNINTALMGYLVEEMAQMPFDQYCHQQIFRPLKMLNTSWFLRDLPQQKLVMPYHSNGRPIGHYSFPDYPNGQLRSGLADMTRFLMMFMNGGQWEGQRVLNEETVQLMMKHQFHWFEEEINGVTCIGHDGEEQGVSTALFFNPKTEIGLIILSNKEGVHLDPMLSSMLKAGEAL